jgi:hypothetical protein
MKHLPAGCNLTEAVHTYSHTLATVKPKLISDAVEEFIEMRKPQAQAPDGKRARLSACYAALRRKLDRRPSGQFPGHDSRPLQRTGHEGGSGKMVCCRASKGRQQCDSIFDRNLAKTLTLPMKMQKMNAKSAKKNSKKPHVPGGGPPIPT